MSISSFRDLDVWKAAVELAAAVYRVSASFPPEERFGLSAQLKRSSISVASNIAEGHARNSTREFVQFVAISLGSLAEVETQVEIAARVIPGAGNCTELLERIAHLRARLLNLRTALRRRARGIEQDGPEYEGSSDVPSRGEHAEELAVPVPRVPCPVSPSP